MGAAAAGWPGGTAAERNPLKVAVHNDGPELRGGERQLLLIARGLAARQHDVAVSCRAGSAIESALATAGIRTTRIRPRGDLDVLSAVRFRRWLKREQPDVLFLTSWKRVPVAVMAARTAGVQRIVVRLGLVKAIPSSGQKYVRYRTALEHVDALILNSQDSASAWRETAPWFDDSRVHVIPNAIEPLCAAPLDRRTLGVPAEARLLLAVAGLEKRKGIATLLDAMALLPSNVHVLIAGTGPDRDALRARADRLGIAQRVHWLGFRDDVPALMATANAFVLPSRRDSFASSVLEAMMAGLPIVTTTGCGVSHALGATAEHGPAGWLVTPDEPDQLAKAIAEAISSDAVVRGAEARRRACEWFHPERMISSYENILGHNLVRT